MERLASDQGMRLRTIDIDEWGSPVAKQHEIRSLPTVWLYDGFTLVEEDYREILRAHESESR